ncbi:MAG TPA: endonuclease/exonuclease/phosphatase family protein [Nocardioidaceae bacterium]|nr:endonuclease/exonuclease/phosphatase family protein [Nocardioidaceae bacterium]
MRVATFNILHGRSPEDDRVDVDRYAKAIHQLDADVLGLQEVDRNQPRSENADLTAVAADAMGAAEHRFVAALSGSPGATWIGATGDEQPDSAAYGIAFLSRYPVRAWEVIRLPAFPTKFPMVFQGSRKPVLVRDEPRVAVAAVVDTPHGEFTMVNTHLSFLRWWNKRQLRTLGRALEDRARPMLLLGDLNMEPQQAHEITGMRPLASRLTFPAHAPIEQIDHILGAGDLPSGPAAVHLLDLSDHRALSVDLR